MPRPEDQEPINLEDLVENAFTEFEKPAAFNPLNESLFPPYWELYEQEPGLSTPIDPVEPERPVPNAADPIAPESEDFSEITPSSPEIPAQELMGELSASAGFESETADFDENQELQEPDTRSFSDQIYPDTGIEESLDPVALELSPEELPPDAGIPRLDSEPEVSVEPPLAPQEEFTESTSPEYPAETFAEPLVAAEFMESAEDSELRIDAQEPVLEPLLDHNPRLVDEEPPENILAAAPTVESPEQMDIGVRPESPDFPPLDLDLTPNLPEFQDLPSPDLKFTPPEPSLQPSAPILNPGQGVQSHHLDISHSINVVMNHSDRIIEQLTNQIEPKIKEAMNEVQHRVGGIIERNALWMSQRGQLYED